MSNKQKEPWEQSIYDTKEQEVLTRRGTKKSNSGSRIYMVLLVISLFLLISLPTGWYIYQKVNESNIQKKEAEFSKNAAKSSSTEVSKTEESKSSTEPETEPSEEEVPETTEVIAGEGVNQVSERTGVPVETLLKLNGFKTIDEWFAVPGQVVRIK